MTFILMTVIMATIMGTIRGTRWNDWGDVDKLRPFLKVCILV
jgi:hypothetical protein